MTHSGHLSPTRRDILAFGSAGLLSALVPASALAGAAESPFEIRLGHIAGSEAWTEDDPRLAQLLREGLVDASAVSGELRGGHIEGSARLVIHHLHASKGLDTATLSWTAPWYHEGRFDAYSYNTRDTVSPVSAPVGFLAPVHPSEGVALSMRHTTARGAKGEGAVRLMPKRGVTLLALRASGEGALVVAVFAAPALVPSAQV